MDKPEYGDGSSVMFARGALLLLALPLAALAWITGWLCAWIEYGFGDGYCNLKDAQQRRRQGPVDAVRAGWRG